MSREQEVVKIVEDRGGVIAVAKNVVAGHDSCGLTEHDLSAAISAYAQGKFPDLTEARAFTKAVTEGSDGLTLRKALEIAKQSAFVASLTPLPR